MADVRVNPRERFGFLLSLTSKLWRAEINRRLAPFGLTESRWLTLFYLSRQTAPVTQKELAEITGVRGPTMVRTLDHLEAESLVERCPIRNDRRAKSIHLTAKAAPILARIQATAVEMRTELFADLDETDLASCVRVFERISARLGSSDFGEAFQQKRD